MNIEQGANKEEFNWIRPNSSNSKLPPGYFSEEGLLLVVVHVSKTDAQRHRPPLCSQQFSLANYACANLPFMPLLSATRSPPSDSDAPPTSSSTATTTAAPPPPTSSTGTSPPPPSLPGRRGGGHRHGGHHRRRVGDGRVGGDDGGDDDVEDDPPAASPAEENCCRWLKEMDSECVCDVLVRLPPFLAKPSHVYSVHVYDGCIITFSCSGRIVP
ncbi:hypothetical protein LINGRAHAP2_LOCUS16288 [Linum grandiflorum]